uniref:NADH-ubiquinone oxidoreductase chain 4 n=1 Tax=Tricholepidion gertschi TaxID=89825 RepID=Q85QR9_9INSE|nr:NADH dehydrogenase subunit 4 [Tricholepidion gertschi]AAO40220.1 NADH dehydrogenase subunit 4 [Tricholepidion gertschi]
MLKYLLFFLFLTPVSFLKKKWWLVQSSFLISFFLFSINCVDISYCGMIYSFLGCDSLGFSLILLSFWICSLMIMASESIFRGFFFESLFLFFVVFLMVMLFLTFSSMDLFLFYLFFEGSLIPTLFLILGWGYQPERIQAGVYLLFYTLLASLPLLIGIFNVYFCSASLTFCSLGWNYFFVGKIWYFCMILAFLISMPMFLVHLWLPSAHVEAPVAGSMILAGVLLKLGGYGLLRLFLCMVGLGLSFNYLFIGISLIGGFLVSLVCLRQTDLKSLIAYSSVAHMGIVLGGLLTMFCWGFNSSLILMVGHGLCSSGLFCLANISYERMGSRSLLINKGMVGFMPTMSLWWFLLSSSNMAAPPSLNLVGEIGLLNSLVSWDVISMIMLSLLSFFSIAYTLYLYSYSQHGLNYSLTFSSSEGSFREYLLLFLHWAPLNLLVISAEPFMLWV